MLRQDIIREATHLTRAGKLVEATLLLQRMLRGESVPDATLRTGRIPIAGREPPTIDAKPNTVEETDKAFSSEVDTGSREENASKQEARASFRFNRNGKGSSPPLARITTAPHMLSALLNRTKEHSGLGLRGLAKRAPPSTRDIVPEGARFIEGTYRNPAGSRDYKLLIPSGYRGQPLPLIVMLHGCTQSPDDFAAGTRMNFVADEQACFVVYPAQCSKANQAKCWNWFRTTDQQRGRGEPSLIAGITRQVMRDYSVDPKRVYVAGLSAGAAAAAIMGATYNDLYAAIGVHSGLACGAAIDLPSALVAMRQGGGSDERVVLERFPAKWIPVRVKKTRQNKKLELRSDSIGTEKALSDRLPVPTIVFHGDRDTTVHPNNGDQVLEQSINTASTQKKVHRGRVPGGHAYTRTIHTDASGRRIFEHWSIHGAGHAWSGGSPAGSYTDPQGPNATKEMLRFFLEHSVL